MENGEEKDDGRFFSCARLWGRWSSPGKALSLQHLMKTHTVCAGGTKLGNSYVNLSALHEYIGGKETKIIFYPN